MKFVTGIFFFVLCHSIDLSAQERRTIKFGDISQKDFDLPKSPVIDSNTNGIISCDIGSTRFIGNKNRWYSYVYKRHKRIKIINSNAYELGTIKFLLHDEDNWKDRLDELKAVVYNIENGKITQATADKSDIFEEKINPYNRENRLALPSVKEGSIIEYTYTIVSDLYFYIRPWYFQDFKYPCLYSEYEVVFPNMLNFAKARYGITPFFINQETPVKNNSYTMDYLEVYSDDTRQVWAMKDVPAFKEEKFINAPQQYLEGVEFFLARTSNGRDLDNTHASWENLTKDLLTNSRFGGALSSFNTSTLSGTVSKITDGDQSLMESTRHLFFYVRDNFMCIPNNYSYLENDLFVVNKKKKGSVAEINLLLTALLREKGLPADPVLLTTKSFGINSPDFPLMRKMNYVICMVRVYGDTIYLDASRPNLGFGKLSQECYNGHARIISKDGASIYFTPDKIKELKSTRVFITNGENGKLTGVVETALGYLGTEELRQEIKRSGKKYYIDNLKLNHTEDQTELLDMRIDSLDNPEFSATIHYEFVRTANEDILYFNPVLAMDYKENPFKGEQRRYPVSLAYPIDDLYTLSMEIPEGYAVDELPKSVKVSFNENEGSFEYIVQKSESDIQLRSRIKLNEANFPAADYNSLRDFFAFIAKKHSEQIVFKKKK